MCSYLVIEIEKERRKVSYMMYKERERESE